MTKALTAIQDEPGDAGHGRLKLTYAEVVPVGDGFDYRQLITYVAYDTPAEGKRLFEAYLRQTIPQ